MGASAWVGAARARLAVQGGSLEAARVALSGGSLVGDSLGLGTLAELELNLAQNGVSDAVLGTAAEACLAELRPGHADPLGARAALLAADARLGGWLSARRQAIEAQPWLAELMALAGLAAG